MTRANVTVFDGKDLTVKAYVGGDGYPEGDMCIGLLNALKAGTVKDYVTSLSTECDGTGDESAKIKRCWYREPSIREGNLLNWHKKNNRWFYTYTTEDGASEEERILFEEYGYEYNEKKDTITIYYYGKKKAIISKDNVDAWKLLFENSDMIDRALSYDSETYMMKHSVNTWTAFTNAVKNHTEKELVEKAEKITPYIDWTIDEDYCQDVLPGGIQIHVKDKNRNAITFILYEDKTLAVQMPRCRKGLYGSDKCTSKRKAIKLIASIVKHNGENLRSLAEATEICDNHSISDEEKRNKLSELYDKNPWFMAENEKEEAIRRILLM